MQQIVAIFGNLVKENIARNGKKVTCVLYRVEDHSAVIAIFGNFCCAANSFHFCQLVAHQLFATTGNFSHAANSFNIWQLVAHSFFATTGNFCDAANSYHSWKECAIIYSHNREMSTYYRKTNYYVHTCISTIIYVDN